MTSSPPSDLRRDLELLDAALMDTVERMVAAGGPPTAPDERRLCRRLAARVLGVAEALQGLVSRPDVTPEDGIPADDAAPGDVRVPLRAVA